MMPCIVAAATVGKAINVGKRVALLHMEGTNGSTVFSDGSGKAWTATSPTVISTAISKFGTASMYNTGTTGRIATPASTDLNFAQGDWTIDMWVYPTALTNANACLMATSHAAWGAGARYIMLLGTPVGANAGKVQVGGFNAVTGVASYEPLGNPVVISASALALNTWSHVAVTRRDTAISLYINGVKEATGTTAAPWDFSSGGSGTFLGRDLWDGTLGVYTGYLDEVRITKGQALYSNNFTPPTAAYSDTPVVLLHMDGANASTSLIEASGRVMTAVGAAQVSTTSPKLGTGSLLLDGAGSYLSTPGTADLLLGSGDFTVEAWVKTIITREQIILDFYNNAATGTNADWSFEITSGGVLRFYVYTGTANLALATGVTTFRDGNWHHVAACRSGGTLKLFLDGVQEASAASAHAFTYQSALLGIGAQINVRNAAYDWQGNIDEVRIIKTAMYTANFTPPTAPF